MSFNCNKCKRVFKSQYLLTKHKNRKYSCDTIFQCSECKQIFATSVILTQHKNRKTLCFSKEILKEQIQLQLKQLSIKEQELRLEEQERKFKHELEVIERKKQAFIEKHSYIESSKKDRKEKSLVLNINIITNNYKQYIYNNYKDNDDMSTLRQTIETGYQNMVNPLSDKPGEILLRLYDKHFSYERLVTNILSHCHNKPISQCLFYFKKLNKFFGIYKNHKAETK